MLNQNEVTKISFYHNETIKQSIQQFVKLFQIDQRLLEKASEQNKQTTC